MLEQGRASTTESFVVYQLWVILLELQSNDGAAGLSFGVIADVFGQWLPCIPLRSREGWVLQLQLLALAGVFVQGSCRE